MFTVVRKQWKWKVSNPVSDIELPRVRNARVRYLDTDELSRLMRMLDDYEQRWMRPLIITALETGLRLNNLCELMWSEVNLENRLILISAEKMKNADSLGIPITDRVLEVLRDLQKVRCLTGHVFHDNGKKLYPVKVQRNFRQILEKAEIRNFHFHDLRHTYASYLRQSGVDLHTVSVLMGHRDLRMTKRYAHLNVDTLRAAVEKMCHNLVTLGGKEVAPSTLSA
ncbi:MAG: site-specific integrase [Thermodesulfovibrionales bacterium]|nr:site-specific integrase [Thermodesulfovibrionales bacterium]